MPVVGFATCCRIQNMSTRAKVFTNEVIPPGTSLEEEISCSMGVLKELQQYLKHYGLSVHASVAVTDRVMARFAPEHIAR